MADLKWEDLSATNPNELSWDSLLDAPPPKKERTKTEAAKDGFSSFGASVNNTLKTVTDLAGTNNPVSNFLDDNAKTWQGNYSDEYKAELQKQAAEKAALGEDASYLDRGLLAAKQVIRNPIEGVAEVAGNIAPMMLGGLAGMGAKGMIGLSTAMGAGAVKGGIAETIQNAPETSLMGDPLYAQMREAGVSEQEAKAKLGEQRASYGDAYGKILLGGVIGAAVGKFGSVENAIANMGKGVAKEGFLKSIGKEVVTEIPQEMTETFLGNKGAAAQGASIAADQGVVEAGVKAGILSAVGGAGAGLGGNRPAPTPAPADILQAETVDDAINTFSDSLKSVGSDWQAMGIEPSGETSNIAAYRAGQEWQAMGTDKTGSLDEQRLNLEREGAARSVERDATIAAIGQQFQDLGITQPADDLQAQRAGMRPLLDSFKEDNNVSTATEIQPASEPSVPAISPDSTGSMGLGDMDGGRGAGTDGQAASPTGLGGSNQLPESGTESAVVQPTASSNILPVNGEAPSKDGDIEIHRGIKQEYDPSRKQPTYFFSEDKKVADGYASENGVVLTTKVPVESVFDPARPEHVERVLPKIVQVLTESGWGDGAVEKANKIVSKITEAKGNNWQLMENPEVRLAAHAAGFDGMVIKEDGARNIGMFKNPIKQSSSELSNVQNPQAPAGTEAQAAPTAQATDGASQPTATAELPRTGNASVQPEGVKQGSEIAKVSQLKVAFGGKSYPVDSINEAQEKWSAFRDATGAGVSEIGNGVPVTDQDGNFIAQISYNGRAWDSDGINAKELTPESSKSQPDQRLVPKSKRAEPESPVQPVPSAGAAIESVAGDAPVSANESVQEVKKPDLTPDQQSELGGVLEADFERQFQQDLKDGIKRKRGLIADKVDAVKKSPFKAFLSKHGLSDSASDIVGDKNKFRANQMLPGLFRRNGLGIDMLAERAVEAGFISQSDFESDGVAKITAMIQSEFSGDAQIPADMADENAQARADKNRRMDIEDQADSLGLPYDNDISTDKLVGMVKRVERYMALPKNKNGLLKPDRVKANALEVVARIERKQAQYEQENADFAALTQTGKDAAFDVLLDDDGAPIVSRLSDAEAISTWLEENTEWDNSHGNDSDTQANRDAGQAGAPNATRAQERVEGTQAVDSSEQRAGDQEEGLTAPTREDVLAQQERTEKAERVAKAQKKAQDLIDKREQERKDIAARSVGAADSFQLGGDAEQNLTGQGGMFDAPAAPEATPAAEATAILDAAEVTGKERIDVLKDVKKGDITTEELKAAYPAKAPIGDFGQKIGGAKKDTWTGFKDDLTSVSDDDIASRKLSEIWPAPDYQKMIDDGMDAQAVAVIRSMRDEIPAKPRTPYKVKRWAEQVKMLRGLATKILNNKDTESAFITGLLRGSTGLQGISGRADLYFEVGHGKSLEGIRFSQHHYSLYRGRKDVNLWVVERDAAATAFSNWPQELATGDTKEQAIEAFKEKYDSLDANAAVKKAEFVIFTKGGGDKGFYIGKKIGRNIADMGGPFDSLKEARAYREKNLPELEAKLAKYKEIPKERRDTNEPRVGEDMRNGQDVTPEMFTEAFGFKGVEFGNYVEQKRRQKDLNDSFDALMDMAAIMGVPAKALSLNGELGLAFGARGSGGVNPAAAHYESDKIVINLTKREGAGSLGHEFWHALDNYFSRARQNRTSRFMTTATDVDLSSRGSNYIPYEGVRKEMIDAFGEVVKSIRNTAIKARSSKMDAKRTKEYWTTGEEMAARAFESYLISRLHDQNASNDYLANVVDQKTWDAMAALGMENEDSYPYPTAGEMPVIRAGFDKFFETLQTKETDQGVAMFSRGTTKTPTTVSALQSAIKELTGSFLGNSLGRIVATTSADVKSTWEPLIGATGLASEANGDAQAFYDPETKTVFLLADRIEAGTEQAVLAHELMHAHGKAVLGQAGWNKLHSVIGTWASSKEGSQERMVYDQASAAVERAGAELSNEELFPYAVEFAMKMGIKPDMKGGAVARWLESVRQNLKMVWQKITGKPETFKAQDLVNLAYGIAQRETNPELRVDKPTIAPVSRNPDKTPLYEAMRQLSRFEDSFQTATSYAKDMADIASEMTAKSEKLQTFKVEKSTALHQGNRKPTLALKVTLANGNEVKLLDVFDADKAKPFVVIGNSEAGQNVGGSTAYQIAFAWAHNNGKTMKPDPAGLTVINRLRRTEAMISSALHFGTTKHLEPHQDQYIALLERMREGGKEPEDTHYSSRPDIFGELEALKEKLWTSGDSAANIATNVQHLLEASTQLAYAREPSIRNFEVADGELRVRSGRETAIPLADAVLDESAGEARILGAILRPANSGVGASTLQRAAISGSVARAIQANRSIGDKQDSGNQSPDLAAIQAIRSVLGKLDSGAPEGLSNVLYSRNGVKTNPNSWDAPEESRFDDLVYKLQDKQIDTKRVTQAIRELSGTLADEKDVYLQEELYHGRAAARTEDFVNKELAPLIAEMKMRGIDIATLDEYLHARHAQEANELIADRNPDIQDGGSGMTTQAAKDYLAKLKPEERKRLESVAAKVDAILGKTRQMYADYSLESDETVKGWGKMFKNYVPLMREDKDGGMGIGQGFSIKGKETKGRTGSTRKVVDILANIAMQRERAIVRGEKNRVATALVGLVATNPNPDFWKVGPPPTEKVYDPKSNSVVERADPLWTSRDNVVMAKVKNPDGTVKQVGVVFNEDDDRALRMAQSLKNLDATQLEGVLGVSAKISRYFAAINTQYNPVFGTVNLVRDFQGALLNLATTPLKGHAREIAGHTLSALKGVYLDARAAREGKPQTSSWAALWEDFQNEGGQTGYRDMFANSADRAKAIEHELNPTKWMDSPLGKVFTANGALKVPLSIAQKQASGIFDWLSDYNLAMENAVRLAAYKVGLEQGMSKQQAASLGKNLTVNFNRKGQVGQQAGALYAFFNASMQGSARLGKTLFDMDGSDVKTIRLSSVGKKIVYGGMLLGTMQALLLAAAGFDEDEPPEFVRERSLIIPTGGKGYITIPMPLGLHVIPNMGRIPTEFALGGFKKPVQHVTKLMMLTAGAFNPVGGGASLLQMLSPTAVDPIAALAENKDWTGKPIAKESYNKSTPGHALTKDTASAPSKLLSEAINTMTGGSKYTAGVFSPTPDQIDYLWGQATGGVGRELSKVQQSVTATATGEDLPIYKVPLVGRFYGNADTQSAQSSRFYSTIDRLNEHEAEIKGMQKDGKGADLSEYLRDNPEARLYQAANKAEQEIQKLRRLKREMMKLDAPAERIKAIEERIKARMTSFNEVAAKMKERETASAE